MRLRFYKLYGPHKNHLSVVRSVGSIGIEVSNVDFFLIDFFQLVDVLCASLKLFDVSSLGTMVPFQIISQCEMY